MEDVMQKNSASENDSAVLDTLEYPESLFWKYNPTGYKCRYPEYGCAAQIIK